MENNLTDVFDQMKLQEYKREKLIELTWDQEKGIYRENELSHVINEIIPKVNHHLSLSVLEFYYYNCESVKDYGWGCAWRCIQTVMGTIRNILFVQDNDGELLNQNQKLINCDITFKNLFMSYGSKINLEELFLSNYQVTEIPNYLRERNYAPFETQYGWAEPFIAKLILSDYGIDGDLFLLNSYSNNSYSPIEVFDRTVNYEEFRQILVSHFKDKPYSPPIIFDDTLVTLCIIGASINPDNIENLNILIADPHVKQDVNGDLGIYSVILNREGNFTNELNIHSTLNGKRIQFGINSFMVYIPKVKFI